MNTNIYRDFQICISVTLNLSIIKELNNNENESQDSVLSAFKPLALSVIDILRDKKKRSDVDPIYNHIIKTQASNTAEF